MSDPWGRLMVGLVVVGLLAFTATGAAILFQSTTMMEAAVGLAIMVVGVSVLGFLWDTWM